MGRQWKEWQTLFSWAPKSLQMVIAAMKLKDTPWKKVMTNLDSILKHRDTTLPTNVHLVKAMVFPVIRYGCESWTIKKAEHQRIDAFELWCWRRLLRVLWTARRSNQSILKEIRSEYPSDELMLKMKLQYCGHLMQRTDSLEKTLSLLKLMSIESVVPSNHLIPCLPLLLLPSIFPSLRVFSKESVLRIRWPKYWSFSFSISPSNE